MGFRSGLFIFNGGFVLSFFWGGLVEGSVVISRDNLSRIKGETGRNYARLECL